MAMPAGAIGPSTLLSETAGPTSQDARRPRANPTGTVRRPSPLTRRLLRSRDPIHRYREVTGRRARVRWWQRIQALVLLTLIVSVLGVIVAMLVGIAFLAGTIVLETVS